MFYPTDRTVLFIDGANFYSTMRNLELEADFVKIYKEFSEKGVLIRANYFTMVAEGPEYTPLRPLLDFLDYNGYSVHTKLSRERTDAQTGQTRYYGDIKIELALEMIEAANYANHIILFSGDDAFTPVLEHLKRRGIRTTVISTLKTSPIMLSDDLRRTADSFIEITDIASKITRAERIRRDSLPDFARPATKPIQRVANA